MDLALSICLGIGLAAACGFRIFVPLLGMSVAALAGQLELAEGFAWAGTWPALACFLTATVLEIGAYYIPWLDNLLDSIATPAAVVAGTIVTASVVTDMSPLMKWSLALIAGGGTAGLIQSATVALRGTSSATTAGTGNWVVATGELLASVTATILSILLPVLGLALVILLAIMLFAIWQRRRPVVPGKASAV
jgi:Domain of unknown function (DUF4126)